jgi:hypothetical protein
MTVNKEKIKTGVWGAIVGAIIVMIIGFGWGGWVLGSTAEKKAEFNADAEKDTKFKELQAKNRWEREKYVEQQGWATMPFEKEPDSRVSEVCVEQILNGQ